VVIIVEFRIGGVAKSIVFVDFVAAPFVYKESPLNFLVHKPSGNEYVGFLMLAYCKADPKQQEQKNAYCIWRFMIDEAFQKRGYGRRAVNEAIRMAKNQFAGEADTIVLFVEPDNVSAIQLYESCGFKKTDEIMNGEIKYERRL